MPRRSDFGPCALNRAGSHVSHRCGGFTTGSSTLMIRGRSPFMCPILRVGLEVARFTAETLTMAQGGAVREHRPRSETQHWAAAATAGCAVIAVVTRDSAWLCVGALCFALL